MNKNIFSCLLVITTFNVIVKAQNEPFEFEYKGVTLDGVLNRTSQSNTKGLVLIIHGSGKTDAVAKDYYKDIRKTLNDSGYSTLMWDKMGCGKSGGTFDYYQSIEDSAVEAIAAINTLKKQNIPGSHAIGLWGISRAGWVNPTIINAYGDIKFWISVSGVYARENFNYLLEQNLLLEDLPKDSIDLILHEWAQGNRIVHSGGSFEAAQAATIHLRQNGFMQRFNDGRQITKKQYKDFQKRFMDVSFDTTTGQQIYVANFEALLSQVNCPVLAIFGEKDKNVDWRRTKTLYEKTLGANTNLTIKTFPNANHNLFKAKTGGFYELEDEKLPYEHPEGYLATISDWLKELN